MLKKLKNSRPVQAAGAVAVDWATILRGALYAGIGAGATFAIQALSNVDFGNYQMVVGAILAIATNLLHKWQQS